MLPQFRSEKVPTPFLAHRGITFDLAHSRLFLRRDPRFKRDPYRYTTIGIQFAKNAGDQYLVMGVWKNSPAEAAGIKAGDRIEGVNGQPSRNSSLERLGSRLHGPEGTPVRLVMERDSARFPVTVRTRQMLCSPQSGRDTLRAAQN